jgi:hypothetical protein
MPLSGKPKTEHLRLRITAHKLKHSREVAVSYTDGNGIIHRTPFMKSQAAAETKLKEWARGITGIGRVTFSVVAETIEEKGDA